MENLQYPIGRFSPKEDYSTEEMGQLIELLTAYPERYEQLLQNRKEEDFQRKYREGSWTVRQLIHHVADIHFLNYLRVKKALTEEDSVAATINMNSWASLPDGLKAPVEYSLSMLKGVNQRFIYLLRTLDESSLKRTLYHPARQIHLTLKQVIYMATWHVAHHLGHIELAFGLQPSPFPGK